MAPHHKQWATQFEQSLIDVKRLLEQTVERQAAAPVFLTSLGGKATVRKFAHAPSVPGTAAGD